MKRYIEIKTQFTDFHKYENAPEEVKFLRNSHRHIFGVEVIVEVFHDDRDLEFFLVQNKINRIIDFKIKTMPEQKSCEMMSEVLLNELEIIYPNRGIQIKINEDGENGSILQSELYGYTTKKK